MLKKYDDILFFFLIFIILINLGNFLYRNKEIYLQKFDTKKYELLYEHSQYKVLSSEYKGNIDDQDLYSLAGVKYLNFTDPSEINFELQPLTKYLFGISILIFGNANVFQLIVGLSLLLVVYLSGRILFAEKSIALLPSLILGFDRLFKEQIVNSYLDLFQTLTLYILFLLGYFALKKNKLFPITLFWLGIVALSKSFSTGIVAFIVMLLFILIQNKNLVKTYLINSIWAVLVYFLGYLVFFFYHGITDFFFLHIKILKLYKSYVPEYPKGEIFRIMLMGKWKKWWDDFGLANVASWSYLWPLGFSGLIISIYQITRKMNEFVLLLVSWSIIYLFSVSLRLVFPRYMMPVLPSFYILLVFSFYNLIRRIKNGHWN